jgi:hypothetical protein
MILAFCLIWRVVMSVSVRRFGKLAPASLGILGVLALLVLAAPAHAQRRASINAGFFFAPIGQQLRHSFFRINAFNNPPQSVGNLYLQQYARNVATLGRAFRHVPPYALGYNPYPQMGNSGSSYPTITPSNPYSLSTGSGYSAGTNPSYGSSATSDPYGAGYGLSTSPGGGGYGGSPYGGYGGSSYGGYGMDPTYGGLRGYADLTAATGKYWKDIQQARILREQSRVAAMGTNRRRIQDEAEYERMRPTALTMLAKEKAGQLEWARKYAPKNDIWSGRALNTLYDAIIAPGRGDLNTGPTIDIPEDTLKNINLTDGAAGGNVAMLKDGGDLAWPRPLQESTFDEPRKRLSRNLPNAVGQLSKGKGPLERSTLNDIEADLKTLNRKLAASVREMTPSQYIEAKRFLNRLKSAVRALSDPRAVNYFNNTWAAKGRTVSELVRNLRNGGLQFAAAAPGDEAAYSALYQALRAFDARLGTTWR